MKSWTTRTDNKYWAWVWVLIRFGCFQVWIWFSNVQLNQPNTMNSNTNNNNRDDNNNHGNDIVIVFCALQVMDSTHQDRDPNLGPSETGYLDPTKNPIQLKSLLYIFGTIPWLCVRFVCYFTTSMNFNWTVSPISSWKSFHNLSLTMF